MIEKNLSFRIVNYSCDKPTVKLTSVYHKMWKIIHVEVKNLLHIHQTKPKSGLVPCKNSLLSWLDAIIVEFTLLFWMQFYFLGCKWTCVKLNCFAWNFYYIFRTKFIHRKFFYVSVYIVGMLVFAEKIWWRCCRITRLPECGCNRIE